MSHRLGVYWAPGHGRPPDLEYIRALQPPVVLILDPDLQHILDVHQAAPNALIIPRSWALSEQKDDMRRDPEGTGRRHAHERKRQAEEWARVAAERGAVWPGLNRLLWVGINEPPVWEMLDATVRYTVAFLRTAQGLGMRCCALELSVGWPANTGPDTPPNWTPYEPVRQAIVDGGHYLGLHEYWYHTGPDMMWGWHAGRCMKCPWNVPMILTEFGVDNYVEKARWDAEGGNRGWRGHISSIRYTQEIAWATKKMDDRVKAVLPFLTDYRAPEWASFDTAEAHADLLRFASETGTVAPTPTPGPTPPPIVTPPPTEQPIARGVVTATLLNMRNAPGTVGTTILGTLQGGATVPIYESRKDAQGFLWHRIGVDCWVHSAWLRLDSAPQPPPPVGDKWQRSLAFTARWEGEFQAIENDAGNWTGCKVGVGELKGTKWGVSACSYPHLDIKNLRREEAHELFRRDYWIPSGAAQLEWPTCLLVFDTSILHGVGTAKTWLAEVGPNPYLFAAKRLRVYVKADNFDFWGKAWSLRVAELLEAVGA